MRKKKSSFVLFSLMLLLIVSSLILGQRRRRAPWNERSIPVGKKVPDFMVYDRDLKKIPLSNLYKNRLLVIQWGGCT
jgi:hypothetical protein